MVTTTFDKQVCYRLINSKFPPIALFDDVADADEFEALYEIQAMTNPRVQNEVGNLNLLPAKEIPFDIPGCNWAIAPFTHIRPEGSRFSDGTYGIYYVAENIETAITETVYHQEEYLKNVEGFKYERIVMRTLCTTFSAELVNIADPLIDDLGWYDPDDYTPAQQLGAKVKEEGSSGIWYGSVRNNYANCYALFTPKCIDKIDQGCHYEYIWDGSEIITVSKISIIE